MTDKSFHQQRAVLRDLFDRAVHAVSARVTLPERLPSPLPERLFVIAAGKAAAAMMQVALERTPSPIAGLIVTPRGHLIEGGAFPAGIEVIEAGHPIPNQASVRAAQRALDMANALRAQDHLLVLLSGGGSALLAAPSHGITLQDKRKTTRALLECGATIAEINCVRKHLSRIKGGRLALAAGHSKVTTLIISDVPGDDPSFVASGPTVADTTSLEMAREVIHKYRLDLPGSVTTALQDPRNETPSADSPGLARSDVLIIARARDALAAAGTLAAQMNYAVTDLGDEIQAEARHLGAEHAALACSLAADGRPRAVLSGGETTVTVTHREGRGGRNLEYLLALAIALDGAPGISALACDTDGVDGTSNAAGAVVVPDTLVRARALGLDPAAHLRSNNAHAFFERLGDLVVTGPTLTNVNDFRVILIEGTEADSG